MCGLQSLSTSFCLCNSDFVNLPFDEGCFDSLRLIFWYCGEYCSEDVVVKSIILLIMLNIGIIAYLFLLFLTILFEGAILCIKDFRLQLLIVIIVLFGICEKNVRGEKCLRILLIRVFYLWRNKMKETICFE